MVERRVKYGDRSDLHSTALAPDAPLHVRLDQIAAVTSMKMAVDHDGERTEIEPVTYVWLVGNADPIPVAEALAVVLTSVGVGGPGASPSAVPKKKPLPTRGEAGHQAVEGAERGQGRAQQRDVDGKIAGRGKQVV